MNRRFFGIVGMFLLAMVVCRPDHAFAFESDGGAASITHQDGRQGSNPPPDYRYSGSQFNFSMSRDGASKDGAQQQKPAQPHANQPSESRDFFQRIFDSLFGD